MKRVIMGVKRRAMQCCSRSAMRVYAYALLILTDLKAYAIYSLLLPVKTNYRLFRRK